MNGGKQAIAKREPSEGAAGSVQSISRASVLLDAVAEHAITGASLADLVASTGLNRATAHRILKSLVETGLVDQDRASSRYFPGIKLVEIAATAANRFGIAKRSQDGRARIAERTGDTVFLTLRVDRQAVCVARTEGSFPIKTLTLNVGDQRPLGIGAGSLALIAFSSEAFDTSEYTDANLAPYGVCAADIAADATTARQLGYALDEGRIIAGITGLGMPIRAGSGDVVAALSVAAISDRLRGPRRANVVTWLGEEAARLEDELAPLLSSRSAAGRPLILGG